MPLHMTTNHSVCRGYYDSQMK